MQFSYARKGAERNSPLVHELDTTDLDKWKENILTKATNIFDDYLIQYENDNHVELNRDEEETTVKPNNEIFEYNKCEICDKVFINKDQWKSKISIFVYFEF